MKVTIYRMVANIVEIPDEVIALSDAIQYGFPEDNFPDVCFTHLEAMGWLPGLETGVEVKSERDAVPMDSRFLPKGEGEANG
mgnify:CR=1 FL=1